MAPAYLLHSRQVFTAFFLSKQHQLVLLSGLLAPEPVNQVLYYLLAIPDMTLRLLTTLPSETPSPAAHKDRSVCSPFRVLLPVII